MTVVPDTQGRRIKSARLSAGLTQAQLARAVQTSERNIVRWETDRNAPRFDHVTAIARATGKDVEFFTSGPEANGDSGDDDEESDPVAALMHALEKYVDHRMCNAPTAHLAGSAAGTSTTGG